MLRDNLHQIQDRIQQACLRSKRLPEEVTLIAVSKTKPISMIEEIMAEQVVDFGENKPQELKKKYESLPENLRWHMIGHLQRNKVKYIIGKACLIHSVDTVGLAQTIDTEAEKHQLIMPVLVEVNIAREDSKFGVMQENVLDFIKEISKFPHIHVDGLMTIAPYTENPENNRKYFKELKKLYVDIKGKNIDNVTMCNLSMGMTGDFEVAIEEGATMVRVGTGIFGERDYSI
ncbi:MAG: YggS family pyridoxal phosphate-dependent enzyme [Lachnospiraceae bacterium]|nr:YggS family pyridoxal phosphate-dependent enzyme [Lachnospiraceae bacterium]